VVVLAPSKTHLPVPVEGWLPVALTGSLAQAKNEEAVATVGFLSTPMEAVPAVAEVQPLASFSETETEMLPVPAVTESVWPVPLAGETPVPVNVQVYVLVAFDEAMESVLLSLSHMLAVLPIAPTTGRALTTMAWLLFGDGQPLAVATTS
jgi:hypothetical protein